MEEVKNETKQTKTQVFNVIILDKSGSMESIRKPAIDGYNETLAGIQKAQEKFVDTQDILYLCLLSATVRRSMYSTKFLQKTHGS